MKKIISHLKNHKKVYGGVSALVILGGIGFTCYQFCTDTQFMRYCKDEKMCTYVAKRLTKAEKEAYIAMSKYMEKSGKRQLDPGVWKYADMEDGLNASLKIKAASAEMVRQNILSSMLPRDQFPGNYDCMRQAYVNELSNEEVLFLQTPQARDSSVLKSNPQLRDAYILASSKLMKCMNEAVQKKYLEEVDSLRNPPKASTSKK